MLYFSRIVSATVLLSLLLVGCGGDNSANSRSSQGVGDAEQQDVVSSEEKLRARVQSRWDALIKRDYEKAYEFNSPGYKGLHTVEQFKGGFGGQVFWTGAKVARTDVKGDAAKVVVAVEYKAMLAFETQEGSALSPGETALHENWILEDEVWYYVPR